MRAHSGYLAVAFSLIMASPSGVGAQTNRPEAGHIRQIGRTDYAPIKENSGMVPSRSHSGRFWVINDSFNPNDLYLIEPTGHCVGVFTVEGACNLDWEALAIDRHGYLYIGDVGNNFGWLQARTIYQVREPEPDDLPQAAGTQPARGRVGVQTTYTYTFPATPFDVEGMFLRQGRLYVVSKAPRGRTAVYEVNLQDPDRAHPLKHVADLPGLSRVTGADLSPDGRRLALCSYEYVAIYDLEPQEPLTNLADRQPTIIVTAPPLTTPTSIEACCWMDERTLLLGAEGGPLYRLDVGTRAEDDNVTR